MSGKEQEKPGLANIQPIDWTETLNEAAIWHSYFDFQAWFAQIGPALPLPTIEEFEHFRRELDFMRTQAARLYFAAEPDLTGINERLEQASLMIDSQLARGSRLPHLLGRSGGILHRLFQSLLVQFAAFAAEACVAGHANLYRCEGLYRDEHAQPFCHFEGQALYFERLYRSQIPVLVEQNLIEDPSIQRCFDFFVGRPKARFCSDTCRFKTYQITKQFTDPAYLAEKQRRYRNKLRS